MEERQDRTGQGERQRGIEGAPVSITEFLLARIAEDEALAEAAEISMHGERHTERWDYTSYVMGMDRESTEAQDKFITEFWPARVLAECAAKRELVDAWHDEHGGGHVLRTLASVYSDHPDYQQKWAV